MTKEREELYEYGLPKYLEDDRISKECADYLRNKYFFGNLK